MGWHFKGRWTDTESNKATIDLDSDELSALADAIRQQDETFPEVDMLLEQIGDTPELTVNEYFKKWVRCPHRIY